MRYILCLLVFFIKSAYTTAISDRLSLLEEHHKNNPTSVCPFLKDWEREDYDSLISTMSSEDTLSLNRMNKLHKWWKEEFEHKTMSYMINTLIYYGYSFIYSTHMHQYESFAHSDTEEKEEYTSQNCAKKIDLIEETLKKFHDPLDQRDNRHDYFFLRKESYGNGIFSLPFVSQDGLASLRDLNHSYGIKFPLIGLPLKRSTYDAVENALPADFMDHDLRHMLPINTSCENETYSHTRKFYLYYGLVNSLILQEPEDPTKHMLDLALFLVGHEKGCNGYNLYTKLEDPLSRKEFIDMCNRTKDAYIKSVERCVKGTFAATYGLNTIIPGTTMQKALDYLAQHSEDFASREQPGYTITPVEWIKRKNLSRERMVPVNQRPGAERSDLLLFSSLESDVSFSFDSYNELLGISSFLVFNKQPISFWIEGELNIKGLSQGFSDLINFFRDRYKDRFQN